MARITTHPYFHTGTGWCRECGRPEESHARTLAGARPASMRTLKTSARESCRGHGHDMSPFRHYGPDNAVAECRACGMDVQCLAHPKPNEIAIGGSAVALNCGDTRDLLVKPNRRNNAYQLDRVRHWRGRAMAEASITNRYLYLCAARQSLAIALMWRTGLPDTNTSRDTIRAFNA